MDKRLTLLVLSLMVVVCMFAQTNATQSINEIKSHPNIYLYAESTSQTWEEALDNAKYLLGVEIETWVKTLETPPADGYIAEAQNHIYNLKSMRGDRFRAFVYVKKTDVVPYANASQLVVVPISKDQETTISEVTATQPDKQGQQTVTRKQSAQPEYLPSEFEQEMMSITDANNIGTFIKRLKSEGRVVRYGKYKDMPSDIDCYLFVYNREMAIPAYLHKQGNTYTNIKTGKQDQVTNYTGCGAWWFQLK